MNIIFTSMTKNIPVDNFSIHLFQDVEAMAANITIATISSDMGTITSLICIHSDFYGQSLVTSL